MKPARLSGDSFKRYKFLFLIIAMFALIITMTITILFMIKPFQKNQTSKISPTSIISNYIKPGVITGLSTDLYSQQSNLAATIQYRLGNKDYSVNIATKDSLIFYALNKTQKNDASLIQNQTLKFLKQYGLTKTSNSSTASDVMLTTTYSNSDNVCQLVDFNPSTVFSVSTYHEISCTDSKAIINEYSTIENLLNIYKKIQKVTDLTKAIRFTAKDKDVSYSIIYLTTQTSQLSLLFAAVNNNWEYIGDLSAGDIKYISGKYIITPEIKSKISNSKYKGFLLNNIQ